MECRKCQSQDGEYLHGISKKNGAPWHAWKCAQCGEFHFQNAKPNRPQLHQDAPGDTIPIKGIEALISEVRRSNGLLKQVLDTLTNGQNPSAPFGQAVEPSELEPDEDLPF